MKRDEFWLGLCLFGILATAGFFNPIFEKINECLLNKPIWPATMSFYRWGEGELRGLTALSARFDRRVLTHNPARKPQFLEAPYRKAPSARAEWERG